MVSVAVVAAVMSYERAYALVWAHGETGWTARLIPLTVDGLIYASSMVMLMMVIRSSHTASDTSGIATADPLQEHAAEIYSLISAADLDPRRPAVCGGQRAGSSIALTLRRGPSIACRALGSGIWI